jgi:anti-sigma regulatory factor (Ser/Thr protein kinase)
VITRASFPSQASAVAAARSFVMAALPHLAQATRSRVELMVSELSTNAVKHARTTFDVTVLVSGDEVRVEVNDEDERAPVMRRPAPTDVGGRGLVIVHALADDWGVDIHDGDKTVWFSLMDRPVDPLVIS